MDLSMEQVAESLRGFKERRDALLHDDESAFEHHLERFLQFCEADPLAQPVIAKIKSSSSISADSWWAQLSNEHELSFPTDVREEMALRYVILESVQQDPRKILRFGWAFRKRRRDEFVEVFRSVVLRPLVVEVGNRIGQVANLATPEAREIQAVPLNRIPGQNEVRIFLSHKSVDKELVYRYYQALKEVGFSPWLDEPDMPAGTNLERAIFQGFTESCAAVFFITDNFKDERYLAAEVDYAVMQKRKKDKKFTIITLRYSDAAPVPDLLTPYIYKTVSNDLEGFYELLRALPLEAGPVRWKAGVVD